jgi:hypothetical protein
VPEVREQRQVRVRLFTREYMVVYTEVRQLYRQISRSAGQKSPFHAEPLMQIVDCIIT